MLVTMSFLCTTSCFFLSHCEVSVHRFIHIHARLKIVMGLPSFAWSLHAPSLSFCCIGIMWSWYKLVDAINWSFHEMRVMQMWGITWACASVVTMVTTGVNLHLSLFLLWLLVTDYQNKVIHSLWICSVQPQNPQVLEALHLIKPCWKDPRWRSCTRLECRLERFTNCWEHLVQYWAYSHFNRGGRYQVFSVRYDTEYFTFDTVDTILFSILILN